MQSNNSIVVHCPTDAELRKLGFYGTTWVFSKAESSHDVIVRYSTCSPTDQFSKKNGRLLAFTSSPAFVAKSDLIRFVNHQHPHNGKYVLPTVEQMFQVVVKLSY